MAALLSDFWVITSYYNPCRYQNRYGNYQTFKNNLQLPLITVQLSKDDIFDLQEKDATILVNVRSGATLWHKERLLNIALKHLPRHVKYVAWLDCDIVFENMSWYEEAKLKLNETKLLQLFAHLYDLRPSHTLTQLDQIKRSGNAIAYLNQQRILNPEDFTPTTTQSMRRGLFGLAWAAKRDLIETNGFYDAMIIGSGDRALACAGYGKFQEAITVTQMNEHRSKHYLNWAHKFHDLVKGNISYLDNNLFHLWHGELENRKYIERHQAFSHFDFDPASDLMLNQDQCWEWKDKNTPLEHFISSYLESRLEDGIVTAQ